MQLLKVSNTNCITYSFLLTITLVFFKDLNYYLEK